MTCTEESQPQEYDEETQQADETPEADELQFRALAGIGIFMLVRQRRRGIATMFLTFDEALDLGGEITALAEDYKGATPGVA